jgi:hypothetical protein
MPSTKPAKSRLKKLLLITGSILIVIPLIIILCISPLTKYLVEKYSIKYTGRQIKMDWAYVNPFTGYVHFSNFKVYEETTDSVFFSAKGISADISVLKIFSKTYEITGLVVDQPKGILILDKRNDFNFSDLIKRFSPSKTDTAGPPLHLSILNIKINNGVFYFHDTLINIHYFIKDVNFESSGKWWNRDTINGKISFSAGEGTGDINGDFTINLKTLDYRYSAHVRRYNLGLIQQYLRKIMNYGSFSANLDADLKATGNFKDENNLDTKGRIALSNFHIGKAPGDDYMSFDKFVLAINEVNPNKHIYNLDSLTLNRPYLKYEKYDHLDNIETMFGRNGDNVTVAGADNAQYNLVIEIGRYLISVSKNFFNSIYKINRVAISNADIVFNDYSESEKFTIEANPLYIYADSVNQGKGRILVSVKSAIKPYGKVSISASINPRDSADFNVNFQFTGIPITLFNPYLIAYSSFPMNRGTVDFTGIWKVRDGDIQSENHLLIIDPQLAPRLKNKDYKWIPMRLVMYLINQRNNVIDYQIPVTGNLNNPEFHLNDIVSKTLKNLIVKPATIPYRIEVRTEENDIENTLALKWGIMQSSILPEQEKFLKKLDKFLEENPTSSITISPQEYDAKEKEYILFFEAKKKYYISLNQGNPKLLSISDSEYIDKMSIRDTLFIRYLNKHLTHSLEFTIQDKCNSLVGSNLVNARFNKLCKDRKSCFLSHFTNKGIDNKIAFNPSQNAIPYNGFSYFKITYKGELPDYLVKAYAEMNKLNNISPREKYSKERKKII